MLGKREKHKTARQHGAVTSRAKFDPIFIGLDPMVASDTTTAFPCLQIQFSSSRFGRLETAHIDYRFRRNDDMLRFIGSDCIARLNRVSTKTCSILISELLGMQSSFRRDATSIRYSQEK